VIIVIEADHFEIADFVAGRIGEQLRRTDEQSGCDAGGELQERSACCKGHIQVFQCMKFTGVISGGA
jgi:hypothetical protein